MKTVIDNISVDLAALLSIEHSCNPSLCTSSDSCCNSFTVCIDNKDLQKVIGFMPEASAYSDNLGSGTSLNNVFDEIESDLFSIDADESGLCLFAYNGSGKEILCSLHSAAIKLNCNPEEVKPRDCVLWPLALTEKKPYMLSIDKDALAFPCNVKREEGLTFLDPGIEDIIRQLFGTGFLNRINDQIVSGLNYDRF